MWNHCVALLEEDFSVSDLVAVKNWLERRADDFEQSARRRKKRVRALRNAGKVDDETIRWIRSRADSAEKKSYQIREKAQVIEDVIFEIANPETESTFPPPKIEELDEEARGESDQTDKGPIPSDMSARELDKYGDTSHVQKRTIKIEKILNKTDIDWMNEEVPREVKEEIAEEFLVGPETIKKGITRLRKMPRK